MSFEDKIQIFYDRVLEAWTSVNTFVTNCEDFQNDWGFKYSQVETCRSFCNDAKREIEMIKPRLIHKTLKCVLIGKVSSGKSTLLNSLLLQKVLPSGFSCRTNCFIEVKKSPADRNYILIGNEELDLNTLKGLADDFSPDALPPGTYIELFYCPCDHNSMLNNDVIIIDTPGFDDVSELDHRIEEMCCDADILILVVSSVIGLGETERKFIVDHQTIFSKPNVIILYTFWDKPQSENIERSNRMRQRLLNQAIQFLQLDLRVELVNLEERVFFVSPEEKLSNISDSMDQFAQSRNDEFDKFLDCLKTNMSKSSYDRRLNIIYHICDTFSAIMSELEFCIEMMKKKETEFGSKLRDDLSVLSDFNEKINVEVVTMFKDSYNEFFDKGLEMIKIDVNLTDEDINDKLNTILQELTVVTVESLKIRIRDLVDLKNDKERNHCIAILESLYFSNYFNLDKYRKSFQIDLIHKSFVEINRVKKVGTGLSIAGAVVGAAATLASGGILAGVVLPIPTLFGASVLGATGAAIGGGAGGGLTTALISFNREAFGYFYKKEEDIMKELWKNMEECIKDSFKLFLDEIACRVGMLFVLLRDECHTLPNKINFLISEANRMKTAL